MNFNNAWPQITYLVLLFTTLLLQVHDHGKPKTGNHSFGNIAVAALLEVWILHSGGFFTK